MDIVSKTWTSSCSVKYCTWKFHVIQTSVSYIIIKGFIGSQNKLTLNGQITTWQTRFDSYRLLMTRTLLLLYLGHYGKKSAALFKFWNSEKFMVPKSTFRDYLYYVIYITHILWLVGVMTHIIEPDCVYKQNVQLINLFETKLRWFSDKYLSIFNFLGRLAPWSPVARWRLRGSIQSQNTSVYSQVHSCHTFSRYKNRVWKSRDNFFDVSLLYYCQPFLNRL